MTPNIMTHPVHCIHCRQCLQDRGPDAIETAVLAWSYSFRRLVMDNVRGVRSEACLLMADIASALGRRIAPHLARLLGPWHFASADAYRDARDNAARGFADLFPGERGAQALQRFAGDVVGFLVETALASPEELGDPSKEPEHELQER